MNLFNTQLKRKENGEYVILKDGKEIPICHTQIDEFEELALEIYLNSDLFDPDSSFREFIKTESIPIPAEKIKIKYDCINGSSKECSSCNCSKFAFLKEEVKEETEKHFDFIDGSTYEKPVVKEESQDELADQLFKLANKFAINKQGDVAVKLHTIFNSL